MDNTNKPILVTGSHRSGTTFIGKMLSLPSNIGYIQEPFNKTSGIKGIDRWNLYIKEGISNEESFINLIKDLLHGKAKYKQMPIRKNDSYVKKIAKLSIKGRPNFDYMKTKYTPRVTRYLIKDPIACMSSEWLHRKFNMDVVVVIRHPAAFVASLKRLNWRFNIRELTGQDELMEDFLNPYLKDLKDTELERMSIVEEATLLWNCMYTVLNEYLRRNPRMIPIRHEDISRQPLSEYEELYKKLGINFTPKIQKKILKYTNDANPTDPTNNEAHVLKRNSKENIKRWKKVLADEEVKFVRKSTERLANQFYNDSDW